MTGEELSEPEIQERVEVLSYNLHVLIESVENCSELNPSTRKELRRIFQGELNQLQVAHDNHSVHDQYAVIESTLRSLAHVRETYPSGEIELIDEKVQGKMEKW